MKAQTKKFGRRGFLKVLAGASVSLVLGSGKPAHGETKRYGKLVDTGRCIGCKRCMSACKRWNGLQVDRDELITDREIGLSANNWIVVNLRIDSRNRGRKTYEHWACHH